MDGSVGKPLATRNTVMLERWITNDRDDLYFRGQNMKERNKALLGKLDELVSNIAGD
jgi:hypothetical protein